MRLPNGFGSVTKMKGNRRNPYRARKTITCFIDEQGYCCQTMKTIGYYTTKEEAITALANYNQNPYDIDSSKITFKEVFEKWSAEHYSKISKSNVHGYNASFKLCEKIQDMVFADVRLHHLQGVVDHCKKNYPTLRKLKVLFNMMYKWSMQHDICAKDYSTFVDVAQYKDRNPNNIKRSIFTDDEIQKLWKASTLNQANSVSIILMMIYSGIRIGELRELEKRNVHLDEKYFYVEKSKTPAGIRNVPIADKVMPFYRYWMNKAPDCKYLIHTEGKRMFQDRNYRDSYWLPVINQLGLNPEHRPHDTRHTCVSLLTKAGIDERLIKKIVGHSGKGITEQVYTHIEINQLLDSINKI